MRILIGSVVLGALLVTSPVLAAETTRAEKKAQRSCFLPSEVNGFNVVDDQTVDVSINPKTAYRLTLFSRSPNIDWSQHIGIETRGGSWICQGMDATIIVPGDVGITRYPVTEVRKLAPEEINPPKKKK